MGLDRPSWTICDFSCASGGTVCCRSTGFEQPAKMTVRTTLIRSSAGSATSLYALPITKGEDVSCENAFGTVGPTRHALYFFHSRRTSGSGVRATSLSGRLLGDRFQRTQNRGRGTRAFPTRRTGYPSPFCSSRTKAERPDWRSRRSRSAVRIARNPARPSSSFSLTRT